MKINMKLNFGRNCYLSERAFDTLTFVWVKPTPFGVLVSNEKYF